MTCMTVVSLIGAEALSPVANAPKLPGQLGPTMQLPDTAGGVPSAAAA